MITKIDLTKREIPYRSLQTAILIYESLELYKLGYIVEIGCIRGPLRHALYDKQECCNDGHSTVHFANTGRNFITYDVNAGNIVCANDYINKHKCNYAKAVCEDGITALENFENKISMLFLDAWDLDIVGSAESHLQAYNAAKSKLTNQSIILIDDTDVDYIPDGNYFIASNGVGGKGELVIPRAMEDGYKVIFTGRQTLLLRI